MIRSLCSFVCVLALVGLMVVMAPASVSACPTYGVASFYAPQALVSPVVSQYVAPPVAVASPTLAVVTPPVVVQPYTQAIIVQSYVSPFVFQEVFHGYHFHNQTFHGGHGHR